MLLHERLHEVAGQFGDKVALSFAEGALRLAELDRRSRALAATLRDLGVGPGGRVAMLGDSCAALVVALWATLNAGGIAVYLNEQLAPEALGDVLDDCEPAVLIASRRYADAKVSRLRRWPGTGRRLVLLAEAGVVVGARGGGGPRRPACV